MHPEVLFTFGEMPEEHPDIIRRQIARMRDVPIREYFGRISI
jgi:uncharacterized protein with HEPN domain